MPYVGDIDVARLRLTKLIANFNIKNMCISNYQLLIRLKCRMYYK